MKEMLFALFALATMIIVPLAFISLCLLIIGKFILGG